MRNRSRVLARLKNLEKRQGIATPEAIYLYLNGEPLGDAPPLKPGERRIALKWPEGERKPDA